MIAVDSNILVYAHRRDSIWHRPALACLIALASGSAVWAIPWPCLHEFLAISTHRKLYDPPSTTHQAIAQIENWRGSTLLSLIGELDTHWGELKRLAINGKITNGQFHDARIAAICLEHGVSELWTADRDFSRFPILKTRNPLVA